MNGTTRDYSDRQVDLECLQTVLSPVGSMEMSLTASDGASRQVAGVQKAIQRYVTLFLTTSDSVLFPQSTMNTLLAELRTGSVSNLGYLRHLFNMANTATLDTIRKDDYTITQFGEQPDDEVIESVTLNGMTIDYDTSTLGISLVFRTKAGSDYTYVLPVNTGRG